MCGIAGFVDFEGLNEPAARERIRRMTDLLLHRGPDDKGYFVDEKAALGHRRLAIIDLATGQQPMSVLDGEVQIVFNGEIYNFQDVRAELKATGSRFRTNSDTEVILRAYLEWGFDCVTRFNGMFAFAIWDRRTSTLFLARDRLGKKPIYYYRRGSLFAFASELKSLQFSDFDVGDIDIQAVDCYLTMGYVPSPRTIYKNVRKLRSAHTLVATAGQLVDKRYWALNFGNRRSLSSDAALEEFSELLDDAVKCRLVSEVPLGAFLSGGLDSSLIVASMARAMNSPVKTHTIDFEDNKYSEARVAKSIANHLGTDHAEYTVRPDAAAVLEKIAWHFDEPFADSSALPTWYVCQHTRQSVTVALSGDGGDEGFGGYTFRYLPHMYEAVIRKYVPPLVRSSLFGALGRVWPSSAKLPRALRLKTVFQNLSTSDVRAFFQDMTWLQETQRRMIYRRDFLADLKGFEPLETVAPFYLNSESPDALGRCQDTDVQVYLTDDVLVKVDRMSMAHSLEVRAPLLDYRILEFAAGLPQDLRAKGRAGKILLRRLAAERLPAEVHSMPKRGFSIPAAQWLRGELRETVEETVFNKNGVLGDYLEMDQVARMWREHLSGNRDYNVLFWGLMMMGLWGRANRKPIAEVRRAG